MTLTLALRALLIGVANRLVRLGRIILFPRSAFRLHANYGMTPLHDSSIDMNTTTVTCFSIF